MRSSHSLACYRSYATTLTKPQNRSLWTPAIPSFFLSPTRNTKDHDDETLGRVFDDLKFWRQFSAKPASIWGYNGGLLQNVHLTNPEGFQSFTDKSIAKCQKLVARVVEEKDDEQRHRIVRDLDRLSDLICRVLDSLEFIRFCHPSSEIREAASAAHARMFEYMNILNTTPELNDRLERASKDPAIASKWSQEEQHVVEMLLSDFSKSAIDLPEADRKRFVELSNHISQCGEMIHRNSRPYNPIVEFSPSRLRGLSLSWIGHITKHGVAELPLGEVLTSHAIQRVDSEWVREKIYTANRISNPKIVGIMDEMLKARAQLAQLSKYCSFGEMTLPVKMAQSPAAVNAFLQSLLAANKPSIIERRKQLTTLKAQVTGIDPRACTVEAWDWEYWLRQYQILHEPPPKHDDKLSDYFSLGSVMQGLSRLFSRIYGIRLVPRVTEYGEVWNDEVRRLDVVTDDGQHIAVMYCDLFKREGKSENPAHCTLRSSRRISTEEEAEAVEEEGSPLNDGMPVSSRDPKTGAIYQLPIIALICDFAPPQTKNSPTMLTFHGVETLFHEMGHAVHSFLGRTEYQNVAGTRCATDFAELPSIIMESFVKAPEVLQLFAKHHETGQPLPYSMVEERIRHEKASNKMENELHILQAMLDQACHSELASDVGFSSTKVFHDVWDAHATLQEPAETSWQGQFGHLVHYGAVYYSYLFDRAISGKIWNDVFRDPNNKEGALSPVAGDLFKEQVLKWGGSRSGWECVAGVLKRPDLAKGGEAAMKEVGRWGVA